LTSQTIKTPGGGSVNFEVESFRKHCLLNGLDDIGLTMMKAAKIDAYEAMQKKVYPWL
jgi:3-isopropylmalate/(R)-2-methylmalate dehydratase small subunit